MLARHFPVQVNTLIHQALLGIHVLVTTTKKAACLLELTWPVGAARIELLLGMTCLRMCALSGVSS